MFFYKTENHLDSAGIKEEDIYLIVKNVIPNKVQRWGDISFGKSIAFPLKFLF